MMMNDRGMRMVEAFAALEPGVTLEQAQAFASRLVSEPLIQVGALDVGTYVVALAVILATAVATCLVPSRRALRMDPANAFRGA